MFRIAIVRQNGTVRFEPSPATIRFEEAAQWFNLDPIQDHEILGERLPRLQNNDPASTSERLIVNAFDYQCSLHPAETGRIELAPAVIPALAASTAGAAVVGLDRDELLVSLNSARAALDRAIRALGEQVPPGPVAQRSRASRQPKARAKVRTRKSKRGR